MASWMWRRAQSPRASHLSTGSRLCADDGFHAARMRQAHRSNFISNIAFQKKEEEKLQAFCSAKLDPLDFIKVHNDIARTPGDWQSVVPHNAIEHERVTRLHDVVMFWSRVSA